MPPEQAPDRTIRLTHVEVTAPHPFAAFSMVNERGWLRIVNDDEIRVKIQRLGVPGADVQIDLVHLVGDGFRPTLQAIGNSPRHVGKLLRPGDDFPARLDTQRLHDRHEPTQDVHHPPAVPHGIDLEKPLPLHQIAQALQKVESPFRRHLAILLQFLDHRPRPSTLNRCVPFMPYPYCLQRRLFDPIEFRPRTLRHHIEPVIAIGRQCDDIGKFRHRRKS